MNSESRCISCDVAVPSAHIKRSLCQHCRNDQLKELNQGLMDALEWVCVNQCRNGDSPDEDHCDSLLNYPCPVKMAYMKTKEVEGE